MGSSFVELIVVTYVIATHTRVPLAEQAIGPFTFEQQPV